MSKLVHTNIARIGQDETHAGDILSYFAADRNITQTTSTAANCQTPGLVIRSIKDTRPTTTTAGVLVVNDSETTLP